MVNKEIDEIIDLCEYLEYDKDFISADILYAEEVDKKLVKSIDILKRRLLKGRTEYGDSIEETDTILKIFNTITNKQLTSDDYYLLMILTKIIRDYLGTNKNGKFDNILDIAGYSCLWLKKRLDK